MHGEKNSTTPIAVDLSFASESWWTNRKEVPRGYLLEELDDIWDEQESAPDLGFEDFESRVLDFNQGEKDKANLDLEDSELVDNILNILLSRNLSDATLGSADFHNKRNAMESTLKEALSKYSLENRRKEDLFDRRKSFQIADLSENEIDDEIQFLEEEIERLKERKKRMKRMSKNSEQARNDSSSENFDSSPPSVPLSPAQSPTSVSPMLTISSSTQPCSCSNCNTHTLSTSHSEISTPRKRMAGMTDADLEDESPKDKRKRRKVSKNTSSEPASNLESSTELITPKTRKISKPKKKTVGKKAVQLFKTEEVLKIKNIGSGDVEEDVDILN